MTNIANTTAAIITDRCSAMPTAVTTESIENTMSNSAIWITAAASELTGLRACTS